MASTKPVPGAAAGELSAAGPPARDERDALIERLERALTDERQSTASLREAADALRFKAEILEKSYAKQLADARQRADAAEQALAEHRASIAEFGKDREDTIRLLKEARAELAAAKLDRDQLARQLSDRGAALDRAPRRLDATSDGGTINQLIANADWSRKKREATGTESHLDARVAIEQDAPHADMLAPELVFTKGKDDQ